MEYFKCKNCPEFMLFSSLCYKCEVKIRMDERAERERVDDEKMFMKVKENYWNMFEENGKKVRKYLNLNEITRKFQEIKQKYSYEELMSILAMAYKRWYIPDVFIEAFKTDWLNLDSLEIVGVSHLHLEQKLQLIEFYDTYVELKKMMKLQNECKMEYDNVIFYFITQYEKIELEGCSYAYKYLWISDSLEKEFKQFFENNREYITTGSYI